MSFGSGFLLFGNGVVGIVDEDVGWDVGGGGVRF